MCPQLRPGSARRLSSRFGSTCLNPCLYSPVSCLVPDAAFLPDCRPPAKVERATQLAEEQGVPNAKFQVTNALDMSFEDESFDLVWACESGEHMPDKGKYIEEMTRVLKPGG